MPYGRCSRRDIERFRKWERKYFYHPDEQTDAEKVKEPFAHFGPTRSTSIVKDIEKSIGKSTDTTETIFGFPKYPPFNQGHSRFPQKTYLGRYLNYLDVLDPRTLFTSNAKVHESVELLKAYNEGKTTSTDRELWEAQKIKSSIIHPDTGEKILPPFRMSASIPFGCITVTGMLLPNPSWPTLLFWQWINQSHNACVNYANRNASQPQPLSKLFGVYFAAVTSACTVAGGLTLLIKRTSSLSPTTRMILQRFVPLPATSLASSLNVLCMRGSEMSTGIEVYDREGTVVGVSKVAAKQAVIDTALTRAFLHVPLLALPPCIMPFFEKLKWVQKSAGRHLIVNAIVCTISFGLSLPVALALFPQESTISIDLVETEIREKTNAKELYYNKGL